MGVPVKTPMAPQTANAPSLAPILSSGEMAATTDGMTLMKMPEQNPVSTIRLDCKGKHRENNRGMLKLTIQYSKRYNEAHVACEEPHGEAEQTRDRGHRVEKIETSDVICHETAAAKRPTSVKVHK